MATKADVINRLINISGIGDAKANELYQKGVRTKTDLRKPEIYASLSRETKFNLRYKIEKCLKKSDIQKLKKHLPKSLTLVGSGRRGSEYSRDIDFLTSEPLNKVVEQIKLTKVIVLGQLNNGEKRISLIVRTPWGVIIRMDIFHATKENWPFALLHHTGPKDFNIKVRAHAKRDGYKLSQYGLFKNNRRVGGLKTEQDILKKIGITYKTPAKRAEK